MHGQHSYRKVRYLAFGFEPLHYPWIPSFFVLNGLCKHFTKEKIEIDNFYQLLTWNAGYNLHDKLNYYELHCIHIRRRQVANKLMAINFFIVLNERTVKTT